MTKTYKVITKEDIKEEQKTVEISEDVTETRKERKTPAQLKESIKRDKEQIKSKREQINEKVDELNAINDNTDLTISDIPSKIALEATTPEKI